MNTRILTGVITLVFILVAVLGPSLSFSSHTHQKTGCPMMPGGAMLCVHSPLLHITHWQSVFVATLAEVVLSVASALLFVHPEIFKLPERRLLFVGVRKRRPNPQNLLQELFSQGILNPKAP